MRKIRTARIPGPLSHLLLRKSVEDLVEQIEGVVSHMTLAPSQFDTVRKQMREHYGEFARGHKLLAGIEMRPSAYQPRSIVQLFDKDGQLVGIVRVDRDAPTTNKPKPYTLDRGA